MSGVSGMGMMMKAMGVDPEEIKGSVTAFMETVKSSIEKIDANQKRIEDKLEKIVATQAIHTTAISIILDHLKDVRAERHVAVINEPSPKLLAMDGTDSGAIVSEEKFPQEVLDAAKYDPIEAAEDNLRSQGIPV